MKLTGKVGRTLNKTKLGLKKHSPEILMIGGAIGVVSSAIMACRATTKLNKIMNEHKTTVEQIHHVANHPEVLPENKSYTKDDVKKDLTITYAKTGLNIVKLYAPSVILGSLSLTCMITSNNILRKRNAALAAAYTAVDSGFKNYRRNVVERFGKEVDKELKYNIKAKEIEETKTDKDGKEKKVKKTVNVVDANDYSEYARFFDNGCDNWQKDAEHNLWYLRQQQNFANEKLKSQGYLFLNEVYDMLGIPRSKAGQIVGWIYDDNDPKHLAEHDNHVDFGIYNVNRAVNRDFVNGIEPTILLDFNVDGPIYNLIEDMYTRK